MHVVGNDVFEKPLIVGDDDGAVGRRVQLVDAVGDDAQGIDIEAGVGLVENRQSRLEDGHLQDLMALLLAAGEALVDSAFEEALVHLDERHPFADQLQEVDGVHRFLAAMLADLIEACAQEVGAVDSRDLHRVLEGQEDALAGAVFRGHVEQVTVLVLY